MTNTYKPLEELIHPAKVRRAGDISYPVLSMTMRSGLVDQSNKFKKRIASIDTSQYRVVTRSQLVVGFPIDEGVLSFQRLYDEAIVSPAYAVWDLVDEHCIDTRYLERFLRSPTALGFYGSKLRGTTARRRSLPDDIFLSLPVPVPPLSEQKRIADVLDQVDALRVKRRCAMGELEALRLSVFLDVFGDPRTNPKQWPVLKIGDLVRGFEAGKSILTNEGDALTARYRVIKVSAITSGTFLPDESKPVPPDYEPAQDHFVRMGDLLFSRANTRQLVGASVLVEVDPKCTLLSDKIWRFVWNEPVTVLPFYLWQVLQTPAIRSAIGALATGTSGSMQNISQAKLLGLEVPVPPIELQKEFEVRIKASRRLAAEFRRSLDELTSLFTSVQHGAFRGAL